MTLAMDHNVRIGNNLGMDHNVSGSQFEKAGHNVWPIVIVFSFIISTAVVSHYINTFIKHPDL